jgi:hypothetical protein
LGNLKTKVVDTSSIYDIATGLTGNMNGTVVPSAAQTQYGDMAVYKRSDGTDYFFTGLSVGAVPFVMRLRTYTNGTPSTLKVILSTSDLNLPASDNGLPRGIAVNSQGMVLTTLPYEPLLGNLLGLPSYDVPVSFADAFPEGQGTAPSILTDTSGNPIDVSSRGMTADAAGNFYVATGSIGTSLAGTQGSGAIVELSPALDHYQIHLLGSDAVIDSQDVAVSPTTGVA